MVHRAKMEEKDFIDKMGLHDVVPRSAAAEKGCRVIPVIAHAFRRAEGEDTVVAVFDVRRAYFYAEEKRDTFVELPDYIFDGFWRTHTLGNCTRRCTEHAQLQHRGERS